MAPLASLWRRLPALVVACIVLVALQGGIALAKDAAPAPAKLPEPLTPEAARELVSRLSDQEVRNLLLQQLDRAAAQPAAQPQATSATGMLGAVHRGAGAARDGVVEIVTAIATMPAAVRGVVGNLSQPDGIGVLGMALGMFVLALVVAALVELVVRRASRAWREDLRTRTERGAAVGRGQAADAGGARGRLRAGVRRRRPRHLPDALAGPRRAPHPAARAARRRRGRANRCRAREPPARPRAARGAAAAPRRRLRGDAFRRSDHRGRVVRTGRRDQDHLPRDRLRSRARRGHRAGPRHRHRRRLHRRRLAGAPVDRRPDPPRGRQRTDRQLGRRPVAVRRDRLPAVRVLRTRLGGDHRRAGPRRGHPEPRDPGGAARRRLRAVQDADFRRRGCREPTVRRSWQRS